MNRLAFYLALPLALPLVVAVCPAFAAPVIGTPTAAAASVARYQKFELTVPVTGTSYTNPYLYDPATGGALLRATFTAPSGAVKTVDGFWQEGYAISNATTLAVGAVPAQNGWRVRFAPIEAGVYTYSLTFQDGAGLSAPRTGTFTATAGTNAGFVRRQTGKNYLRFDSGAPYFPIGENMAWGSQAKMLGDYKAWLDQLYANRANCIRLFLTNWGLELEWTPLSYGYGGYTGLKRYSQAPAYELDWILEYCAARGIYVVFGIDNFGQISAGGDFPQWPTNPYNAANGGPCPAAQPQSFFTNATARAIHKNKVRYLVARYAYTPALMEWEVMNELDMIDNYGTASIRTSANAWISEVAATLKSLDPNKHLVTTSFGQSIAGDAVLWNDANIDVVQTHCYDVKGPYLEKKLADASTAMRAYNKPYQTGEFGIEIYDDATHSTVADDPNAIHFRTTLWMSAFNGGIGPGLSWWWDSFVHTRPTLTYPFMKAVRSFTDANLNVATGNYQPVAPELKTAGGATLTVTPGFAGFAPPTYAATPAPASTFVVSNTGGLTPSAASLSTVLFGSYHATARRAPAFQVNFPVAGQCRVTVAGHGAGAILSFKLDGVAVLSQLNPLTNGVYSINVPAGAHTVLLDNTGTDWLSLTAIDFTNYQSRLIGQALRDGNRLVGYVRNLDFNWAYYGTHNQTAPPATTGGALTVRGLVAGASYSFQSYSSATGAASGAAGIFVATAAGLITIPLANTASDFAFVVKPLGAARPAAPTAVVPALLTAAPLIVELYPNPASAADGATVALPDAVTGPVRYELFDQLGRVCRVVMDEVPTRSARQQALDLRGLAGGAYVLRVSTPAVQRAVRVVVSP